MNSIWTRRAFAGNALKVLQIAEILSMYSKLILREEHVTLLEGLEHLTTELREKM